jgi:hypothetical protein
LWCRNQFDNNIGSKRAVMWVLSQTRSFPGLLASAARYGLAMPASFVGWKLTRYVPERPLTPFLFGIATLIVSSGMPGPGPGVLATALATVWVAWIPGVDRGVIALFFAEGLFVRVCEERFRRASERTTQSEQWHRSLVGGESRRPGGSEYRGLHLTRRSDCGTDPASEPSEGGGEQFDRRLRRQDGTEVWVLACTSRLNDSVSRCRKTPGWCGASRAKCSVMKGR